MSIKKQLKTNLHWVYHQPCTEKFPRDITWEKEKLILDQELFFKTELKFMLIEQLLHFKNLEEVKILPMMEKVRLLTLEGEKQNWLWDVGRDLGGNVLSLPRCLGYIRVTNQVYVLVKILFAHFIIYKFNLN